MFRVAVVFNATLPRHLEAATVIYFLGKSCGGVLRLSEEAVAAPCESHAAVSLVTECFPCLSCSLRATRCPKCYRRSCTERKQEREREGEKSRKRERDRERKREREREREIEEERGGREGWVTEGVWEGPKAGKMITMDSE